MMLSVSDKTVYLGFSPAVILERDYKTHAIAVCAARVIAKQLGLVKRKVPGLTVWTPKRNAFKKQG